LRPFPSDKYFSYFLSAASTLSCPEMSMIRSTTSVAALAASLLLTGCLTGGGKGGDVPPTQGDFTSTYTVMGDKIITPPQVHTDKHCSGDQLQTYSDTSTGDTLTFALGPNTLTLFTPGRPDSAGTVIRLKLIFTRTGIGAGLEGTWTYSDAGYEVISGTMTAEEISDMERTMTLMRDFYASSHFALTFIGGTLTTYLTFDRAKDFLEEWNATQDPDPSYADSARYAVTAKALDANTVELTGRASGEVVQIHFSANGDETYSSSDPAHATTVNYDQPTTCPNQKPDWYQAFLEANRKGPIFTLKRGASPADSWPAGLKSGFPSFFRMAL
jgi:hypothetical protein